MVKKITEITVSGDMVRNAYSTQAGDIRVYRRDDRSGSRARAGRHTNRGYSGYYLASIFDGQSWRKLQFNKLIPYDDRSYGVARDCCYIEEHLKSRIRCWKGRVAQYDTNMRSFRIYSQETITGR